MSMTFVLSCDVMLKHTYLHFVCAAARVFHACLVSVHASDCCIVSLSYIYQIERSEGFYCLIQKSHETYTVGVEVNDDRPVS